MSEPVKLNLHDVIFSCCQHIRSANDFSLEKEVCPNLTARCLLHDLIVIDDCEQLLLSTTPFSLTVHYYSIIYFIEFFQYYIETVSENSIDSSLFEIISIMRQSIEFITLKNYVKEIKLL